MTGEARPLRTVHRRRRRDRAYPERSSTSEFADVKDPAQRLKARNENTEVHICPRLDDRFDVESGTAHDAERAALARRRTIEFLKRRLTARQARMRGPLPTESAGAAYPTDRAARGSDTGETCARLPLNLVQKLYLSERTALVVVVSENRTSATVARALAWFRPRFPDSPRAMSY